MALLHSLDTESFVIYCHRICKIFLFQDNYISIHVGPEGVEMGNACWELFQLEHGIQPCGRMLPHGGHGNPHAFFRENAAGRYIPRAIVMNTRPRALGT